MKDKYYRCYAFLHKGRNDEYREQAQKYGFLLKCGYANGYVAIPKNHPLYGVDYSEIEDLVNIHGGITFSAPSEKCKQVWVTDKIEYLDKDIPDGYWVFGFDTMHFTDNEEICNKEWCIQETERLKEIFEFWE